MESRWYFLWRVSICFVRGGVKLSMINKLKVGDTVFVVKRTSGIQQKAMITKIGRKFIYVKTECKNIKFIRKDDWPLIEVDYSSHPMAMYFDKKQFEEQQEQKKLSVELADIISQKKLPLEKLQRIKIIIDE